MLVKQDHPISGIFDAFPEEDDETLWPSLEDLPPTVEGSGFRPAPAPDADSVHVEGDEREASDSGLPTPRALQWVPSESWAGTTPLPVVTAKTEPTQRGLGIPPPPSAKEAAWLEHMPSFVSAPPLTLDAIDREPANTTSSPAPAEPTENERITVRAPATMASARQRWRRRVAVGLLAAAALFGGLFARRAALSRDAGGPVAGALVNLGPHSRESAVSGASAGIVRGEEPQNVAEGPVRDEPAAPAAQSAVRDEPAPPVIDEPPTSGAARGRHRRKHAKAVVQAPAAAVFAALGPSTSPTTSVATAPKASPRESLTLPPR